MTVFKKWFLATTYGSGGFKRKEEILDRGKINLNNYCKVAYAPLGAAGNSFTGGKQCHKCH